MIRDSLGEVSYWKERIEKDVAWLEKVEYLLSNPSKNPEYDPQFTFDASCDVLCLMLRHYSNGDSHASMSRLFPKLLFFWELSNKLSEAVCEKNNLATCRAWVFELSDLNHYIWCFWIVGLALLLEVPNEQWDRVLLLLGGGGQDAILDRVIATRQNGRIIGSKVLHPKPYSRLLKAIDTPEQKRMLLRDFLDCWYVELNRQGTQQPWWYIYGDSEKNPLEMGNYFGRWCIEAAVCAKAFNIDDGECLGHEYYPGDFLRPNGPSTHAPPVKIKKKWFGFF